MEFAVLGTVLMDAESDPIGPEGKAVCGVFTVAPVGVLLASAGGLVGGFTLEKVAKAPDPSPKAVEAEVEGDGRVVTRGVVLLKGL